MVKMMKMVNMVKIVQMVKIVKMGKIVKMVIMVNMVKMVKIVKMVKMVQLSHPILTPEIHYGNIILAVCQKLFLLVKFEIQSFIDNY